MADIDNPNDGSVSQPPVTSGGNLSYNNWSGEVDPQRALEKFESYIGGISTKPSAASPTSISPNLIDISGRYPTQMIGYDNEELYAQGQGFWAKLGNATVKTAGIATTTFLDGTIGLVTGLYSAAADGKFSSFYDNEFSNTLDELNTEYLENNFANYRTEAERNRDWNTVGDVATNIFNANFIFDDVLKNMGFILGMWGSAATYSSVLKGIRSSAQIAAVGKIDDAVSITDDIVRSQKYSTVGARLQDGARKSVSYLTSDPAQRAIISGLSTIGEAKIEALQTAKDYKQSLVDEYLQREGVEPSGEELQRINDLASEAGNTTYGLNTALLTLSNYIVLPKLLGSSINTERGIYNGLKANAIKRGESGTFEQVASTGFPKLIDRAKNIAGTILSPREGIEEGAQFAVGVGTKNFFDKKFRGEDTSIIDDLFGAGISETLGTNEGLENIIIGALSGGIIETATGANRRERKATDIATQSLLSELNQRPFLNFTQFTKDSLESINRNSVLQAEKVAAIRQGDILEASELEVDIAHNYLIPRVKNERFDLVMEDIDNYRRLSGSEQGFQQLKDQGIISQDENAGDFIQRLNNFENHARLTNDLYKSLNLKYSSVTDSNGQLKYTPETIDYMVYASAKIADYNTRIPKMQSSLLSQGVNSANIVDTINSQNTPSTQAVADAINYINNLNVVSDVKDDLKTELSDLIELSLRRKEFMKEYDDVRNNPEKYKNKENVQEANVIDENNPDVIPNRQYSSKPREFTTKKVPNDTKYNLVSPDGTIQATYDTEDEANTQRDFENQKLQSLSNVTPVRKTKSGTYEVITASGNTEYVSPEFFNDYELVKTEEEIATEREEGNKNLEDDQRDINSTSGPDFPPPDVTDIDKYEVPQSPSKPIDLLFVSGTQNQKRDEDKDYIRNLNNFLSNAYNLPSYDNLRVVVVSPSNEVYLGLNGLSDMLLGGQDLEAPISYVAVEQANNTLYFVNSNGDRIGEVNKGLYPNVQLSDVIVNTLPDTDLKWKTPNAKTNVRENRFYVAGATPEEAAQVANVYQEAWKQKREEILSQSDSFTIHEFNISRGVAQRNDKDANGKRIRNSVSNSLIPAELVDTQGIIKVHTQAEGYNKDGQLIKFPTGALILDYGPTLEPLENRQLTQKEATTIFTALRTIAEYVETNKDLKSPIIKRLQNYIQGLVYTGEKASPNRLWFSGGYYNIGASYKAPLTTNFFDNNRLEIINNLQTIYTVANNKKLRDNLEFEEITGFDNNNSPKSRIWKTYQEFLISPDKRSVDQIPFTTSIVNPAKFWNRYISVPDLIAVQEPQLKREEIAVPVQDSVDITPTPTLTDVKVFSTKQGIPISYVGETSSPSIVKDAEYDKLKEIFSNAGIFSKMADQFPENTTDDSIFETLLTDAIIASAPKQEVNPPSIEQEEVIENNVKENPPVETTEQDPLQGDYREVVAHWDNIITNINKEEKWFKDRFDIPFNRLSNLIKTTGGGYAWGMFKDKAVYIYENAEVGTTYHEAFEAVWGMFTDLTEKKNVLSEFNSRPGTYIDRVSGTIIPYSEATEKQSKEQLAEEFRDYILNNEIPVKPVKGKNFIYRLFSQLRDFIRKFFTSSEAQSNTQALFEKINAGYYKGASSTSSYSTDPEYREIAIQDLSFADTYRVIQGVTADVFQQLFLKQGSSSLLNFDEPTFTAEEIYSQVYKALEERYNSNKWDSSVLNLENEDLKIQYQKIWNSISKDWDNVKVLTDEFLRTFGVKRNVLQTDDTSPFDKEDSDVSSREDSYLRDSFTFDFAKEASTSVKLLIGTLTEAQFAAVKGDEISPKVESKLDAGTYMQQLVSYSSVFNNLMNKFVGTNDIYKKKEILRELSNADATYVRLFNRLGLKKDFNNFSKSDWKLWVRFLNVFSRQRPQAFIEYRTPEGTFVQPENINISIREITQGWIDTWKSEDNKFVSIVNDQYTFDGSAISKYPLDKPSERIKFLNDLGIDVTYDMYKRLNKAKRTQFDSAIAGLKKGLSEKTNITQLTPKNLGQAGTLQTVASIYFEAKNEGLESTFNNINGDQTQQNVQSNVISYIVNDINNASNFDELLDTHPEYGQLFQSDSLYLNDILFTNRGNKRKGKTLTIGYNQGIVSTKEDKTIQNSKLTEAQRLLNTINANINKLYNVLVPADSKTEWNLEMEHIFSFDAFLSEDVWNRVNKQLEIYFNTEKQLAGNNKSYNGLTYPMLADENNNFSSDKVRDFINSNNEQLKSILSVGNELKINADSTPLTYVMENLDSDFMKQHSLKEMNEQELDQLLNFISVNYMINNIELHKLFFGDKNNIALKRYKSFLSPVERSQDSPEMNNFLNKEYNTVSGIQLKEGDPGHHNHKSYLKTASLADVITSTTEIIEDKSLPEGTRKAYSNNNISDAQAQMTLTSYREAIFKRNAGFTQGQEEQANYLLSLERYLIDKDSTNNIIPEQYRWNYSSDELKQYDLSIVNKGNPNTGKFAPLKPLAAGQAFTDSGERVSFLDKHSTYPMWYSLFRQETKEGVNLTAGAINYLKMMKEGIDYTIYDSGRKVGNQFSNDFYSSDSFKGVLNVPFNYWGIQVETQGEKKRVTLGKQTTRLDKSNLLNAGVPIDSKLNLTQWNNLTEEEKLAQSPVYQEVKLNEKLLEERIFSGYQELLDKFDIIDNGSFFEIPDLSKVETLLQDELFRREASANKKDAVRLDPETGDFLLPFEATSAYQEIKSIIFSYVDKLIAKPKVGGGQRIQISHAGFELAGDRIKTTNVNGKEVLVSTGLKFYKAEYADPNNPTKENRTSVSRMEVLLPNWFADKLRSRDINKSNEELLTYLNSTDEGKRILQGVGFRIPTQELNSIEAFVVKGFLPEELGDSIVLPDAITTKAGSDFDIDKLNVYLKNVYIDGKGNPRIMKFERIDTSNQDDLKDFYEEHVYESFKRYKEQEKKQASSQSAAKLLEDIFNEDLSPDVKELTIVPSIEEFLIEADGMDIYELNRKYNKHPYSLIVENEYFESIERLVLLPQNFERLVQPNSKAQLLAVKDELVKAAPSEFGLYENQSTLSLPFMSRTRHLYLMGKGGVGIAALSQTNNALNQAAPVYIDPNNIPKLPKYQRDFIGNGSIKLPHNTITIIQNGIQRTYPTISLSLDRDNNYISNQISQYIDGFVDVANDPFISQIIQSPALISTFMTMHKLGIPRRIVGSFMNQPIIREYIKLLQSNNTTYLYNSNYINETKLLFPINVDEPDVDIEFSPSQLFSNISKYYKDKKVFTQDENIQQRNILNEFLKYTVLSQNMFDATMGTAYDNSRMADPAIRQLMENRTNKAITANIFSSVDKLISNTSIEALINYTGDASQALDTLLFKTSNPQVLPVLQKTREYLINMGIPTEAYRKASNGVTSSFIDFLIQTELGLNSRIDELMMKTATSVAHRLAKLKAKLRENPNTDLSQNFILQRLIPVIKDNRYDAKNIIMVFKTNQAFTSDRYTNAFRELKNNPVINELYGNLYGDLIRMSFLQTGIGRSGSSYNQYIPYEDYGAAIAPLFDSIDSFDNLNSFSDNLSFLRNNWQNTDLVPHVEDFYEPNYQGIYSSKYKFYPENKWYYNMLQQRGIDSLGVNNLYKIDYRKRQSRFPIITMSVSANEFDEMNGMNEPYKLLLRRLEDANGDPIKVYYSDRAGNITEDFHYIYYPINAWGNGYTGQEYYDNPNTSSQFNNGYLKIYEFTPDELIQGYLENTSEPIVEPEIVSTAENTPPIKIVNTSELFSKKIDQLEQEGKIERNCE